MDWLTYIGAITICVVVLSAVQWLRHRREQRMTPEEFNRDRLDEQTW